MSLELPEDLLRQGTTGLLLQVLVNPRAGRNAIQGLQEGRLKVALATPPVDGAANAALLTYLAKLLDLPKSSISLQSGQTSRRKTVLILGDAAAIRAALSLALS